MPCSTSQIATIHTLKARTGLDDESYRDFLQRETGRRSSKELTMPQARHVIDELRKLPGGDRSGSVAGLDGPIGGKLRALWISGYNLGLVRDRSDAAMLKFLQHQTGVSHVRFLQTPRDSASAIEGLKAWFARDARVEWPADSEDVIGAKRAVLEAQWRRLFELGAVKHRGGTATTYMSSLEHYACSVARQNRWEGFKPQDYDDVQQALGRKLRGALQRAEESQTATKED